MGDGAMRVLLADDEPVALARLASALRRVPEANLLAAAKNGDEALTLIRRLKPDVAVLDVRMPLRDGFEVLAGLGAGEFVPEVIFVTAFEEHAVRAFDIHAADYLLKPVALERFREALRRARTRLEARAGAERHAELQRVLQTLQGSRAPPSAASTLEIWVPERGGLTKIATETIDRIDAEGDYVRVHVGASSYLVRNSIAAMQRQLDDAMFVRVHRSTVVNLARVRSVRRRLPRGTWLVLSGGATAAIGPSYLESVMARLRAGRWRAW